MKTHKNKYSKNKDKGLDFTSENPIKEKTPVPENVLTDYPEGKVDAKFSIFNPLSVLNIKKDVLKEKTPALKIDNRGLGIMSLFLGGPLLYLLYKRITKAKSTPFRLTNCPSFYSPFYGQQVDVEDYTTGIITSKAEPVTTSETAPIMKEWSKGGCLEK